MRLQIIQPQEVEVFYILPAIRSRMAATLKEQGMKQKDIAGLLCVQESTISQYLSSKRAAEVKFNSAIDREVEAAVKRIKTKEDLIRETQLILDRVKKEKILCQIHKEVADVKENCDVCFCTPLLEKGSNRAKQHRQQPMRIGYKPIARLNPVAESDAGSIQKR